jgi:hypothetical protein
MVEAHALYIASPDKTKLLEKSIMSLRKRGGIQSKITVVVNSNYSRQKISILPDEDIEIIEDKSHFTEHPPTRWFLKHKSEVCLFFDYDILVNSSLKALVETCKTEQKMCGVIVYDQPIDKSIMAQAFNDCGAEYKEDSETWLDNKKIPRCYNYGVLAVPKCIVEKIRNQLATNIKTINETSKRLNSNELAYFTGQVALSVTIHQLNIPTKDMPLRYNFPDCIPEINRKFITERNNMICHHILTKRMPIQFL